MSELTELYRHFDADGHLLYVGIARATVARLAQHLNRSAWFGKIATITIERFPTREAAMEAELKAIIDEKPIYNVAGVAKLWGAEADPKSEMEKLDYWVAHGKRKPEGAEA